jgi:hypothetical protein
MYRMKKIGMFLLAISLGLSAFSQEEAEGATSAPGVFSSSPLSSNSARAPYCSKCRLRHYNGCSTTPPPPPAPVPIDGGLSFLLAAGAAYGVKRMRTKKQG